MHVTLQGWQDPARDAREPGSFHARLAPQHEPGSPVDELLRFAGRHNRSSGHEPMNRDQRAHRVTLP